MAMFGGRLVIFAGGKAGWGQSGDEGKNQSSLNFSLKFTDIYFWKINFLTSNLVYTYVCFDDKDKRKMQTQMLSVNKALMF